MSKQLFKKQFLAGPYLIWIIGFTVLPLAMILYYAFFNENGAFTLEFIANVASPVNLKALLLSLELSFACTVVCLLLAYPLALILSNLQIKNQSTVVFIFMLPMWMNFMLRLLAWKLLLNKHGVLNTLLDTLGMGSINILNTPTAVVFGMVYEYLPFMILPIYNSMARIKKDYIEAAKDLGANGFTILFKIILPLTVSGIVSGITMVFVPALTAFAVSELLGGGKVLLIGNVIEESFMQGMQWNAGSGLSFVLMLFVFASMAITNIFDKDGEGTAVW
jgi:spermidine/putrescine transport system permease protein